MLGNTISVYRKKLGLTQEQLAQKLEVTNQAVSKWETDQCCPDVALLPKLADVLGISLDMLFGRSEQEIPKEKPHELPWEDDGSFHVVLYCGHELVGSSRAGLECSFHYEGPVRDIYCEMNLQCDEVQGNVTAAGYVECGDVGGHINAGDYVECGDVGGNLSAGGYVECGDVGDSVSAGHYVECDDVGNNVNAGSYVECGDVGKSVYAAGNVSYDRDDEDDADEEGSDHGFTVTVIDDKKGKQKFSFNPFRKEK